MTLVERLRRLGAALQNTERTHCEFCFGVSGATEFEAADEIERLQTLLQDLVESLEGADMAFPPRGYAEALKNARAELLRLKLERRS